VASVVALFAYWRSHPHYFFHRGTWYGNFDHWWFNNFLVIPAGFFAVFYAVFAAAIFMQNLATIFSPRIIMFPEAAREFVRTIKIYLRVIIGASYIYLVWYEFDSQGYHSKIPSKLNGQTFDPMDIVFTTVGGLLSWFLIQRVPYPVLARREVCASA